MKDGIERIRAEIAATDRELVRLLARRQRQVGELSLWKLHAGLPVRDPDREAALAELYRRWAAEEGLDPAFLQGLFEAVHAESRSLQRGSRSSRGA